MKYLVLMNYKYMNSFENYQDAYDLLTRLQIQFKNAYITIEPIY